MGEALKRRLKQKKFQSPYQEAMLNLLVAAGHLEGEVDRACSEFGITFQQYNILRILKGVHPEGHPCGEIADRMLHRSPDVTRRLDALEKGGFVERHRSAEDRRIVVTRITNAGLLILEKMDANLATGHEQIRSKLTIKDCQELSRICEKLYDDS